MKLEFKQLGRPELSPFGYVFTDADGHENMNDIAEKVTREFARLEQENTDLMMSVDCLKETIAQKDAQIGRLIGILPQEARDKYVSACIETATRLHQEKIDGLELKLKTATEELQTIADGWQMYGGDLAHIAKEALKELEPK